MDVNKKIIITICCIVMAVMLLAFPGSKIPFFDSSVDHYFSEAIIKAGVAYGVCRGINATVSVLKDTDLQLEPAGIGVSLAIGQLLDPVDDMTERLSDVLVTAITSLGVQKLSYEIAVSLGPVLISICLIALSVLTWFKHGKLSFLYENVQNFLIIIVVARICLPVSALANDLLYQNYFAPKISEAKNELAIYSGEYDKLKEFTLPEIDGVVGTIKNSASVIKEKAIDFKNALMDAVRNIGRLISNLLKLTYLYVGIFVIQVLFMPLVSFWLLVKVANSLFNTNLPVILKHKKTVTAGVKPMDQESR